MIHNKTDQSKLHQTGRATTSAEALLLDYAAGNLDGALSMIIAAHISMSEQSRHFVSDCEMIGGQILMQDCAPISVSKQCLDSVLSALDNRILAPSRPSNTPMIFDGISIPSPLCDALKTCGTEWHGFMGGMEFMDVMTCGSSNARLLRIAPAIKTPDHSHKGIEVTLILDGAFHDEMGDYHVGDLIVEDSTTTHAPVSCPRQGCVCLTVTTAPIKLTGWMGALINPFLR
jgi:putative transcriptional regulator